MGAQVLNQSSSIFYGLHQHIEDHLQKSGDLLVFDFLTFGYWSRPNSLHFPFFFFLSFWQNFVSKTKLNMFDKKNLKDFFLNF
jgi:hypothetical protein